MTFDLTKHRVATNEHFADEIARLTTLTSADVERLFPRRVDKERLAQLMVIVNSSASRQRRAAALEENFKTFGGSILRLLEQFT